MSLAQKIVDRAKELGFSSAAILPAATIPNHEPLFDWLHEGRHGLMGYMERYQDLRVNPAVLEPGTQSVVVLTTNYASSSDRLPGGLRVARYAHNDDYHDVLRERMQELAAFIHAETGAAVGTRPAVDSAPLLERPLAAAAGLGWIGKHSLLLHRERGSWVILSELLVDLEIQAPTPEPYQARCGSCTACIDACPTGAIISPFVVDARRCISYLTIELKGPIPRELRPKIGDHLFGCDICQDVCPWNRGVEGHQDPAFSARPELANLTIQELISMTQEEFSRVFKGSPLKRSKRRGLLRNAAVVLGNLRAAEDLELLVTRLCEEPEELVRGHIAWAIGRYGSQGAAAALRHAEAVESSPYVLEEIRVALESI